MSGGPAVPQRLDPHVLEQAMLWMVRLQSGACSAGEQKACAQWRQHAPEHELAWQRLAGLGQGLREGTNGLGAANARTLLHARAQVTRRAVLTGLAGAGVMLAGGYSVHQRSLLPGLFSDLTTATGERQRWQLDAGLSLQLDAGSALDSDRVAGMRVLTLNRGRVLLEVEQGAQVSLRTAQARVLPGGGTRLIVHQQPRSTLVQLLKGEALVEYGQGARSELVAGWQQAFGASRADAPVPLTLGADAWTHGQLVAERMPLEQLLTELDRYRKGMLRWDPRVARLQLTGTFSLDDPDASLDLLSQILPVRVQRVLGYWVNVVPA